MAKRSSYRILAGDLGNADEKFSTSECFDKFPHALQEINQTEFREIKSSGEMTPSMFVVNGVPYEVGAQAERRGVERYQGNARYTRDYYGVIAAIGAFKVIPDEKSDVMFIGSYPPKDRGYMPLIHESVVGEWVVEGQGVTKKFRVVDAKTFSEPISAYRHAVMDYDGIHFRGEPALRKGDVLCVDVGGFTTDLTVFVNGIPDPQSARSFTDGIITVLEGVEKAMFAVFAGELQGKNGLSRARLSEALVTGKYKLGGRQPLDVKKIVNEEFNLFLNKIMKMGSRYQGWDDFESILLANGGGAAIEKRFRDAVDHTSIFVSEQERAKMAFSTCWGLLKSATLLKNAGKL